MSFIFNNDNRRKVNKLARDYTSGDKIGFDAMRVINDTIANSSDYLARFSAREDYKPFAGQLGRYVGNHKEVLETSPLFSAEASPFNSLSKMDELGHYVKSELGFNVNEQDVHFMAPERKMLPASDPQMKASAPERPPKQTETSASFNPTTHDKEEQPNDPQPVETPPADQEKKKEHEPAQKEPAAPPHKQTPPAQKEPAAPPHKQTPPAHAKGDSPEEVERKKKEARAKADKAKKQREDKKKQEEKKKKAQEKVKKEEQEQFIEGGKLPSLVPIGKITKAIGKKVKNVLGDIAEEHPKKPKGVKEPEKKKKKKKSALDPTLPLISADEIFKGIGKLSTHHEGGAPIVGLGGLL